MMLPPQHNCCGLWQVYYEMGQMVATSHNVTICNYHIWVINWVGISRSLIGWYPVMWHDTGLWLVDCVIIGVTTWGYNGVINININWYHIWHIWSSFPLKNYDFRSIFLWKFYKSQITFILTMVVSSVAKVKNPTSLNILILPGSILG